jgi:membrane glycosyltransferase
MDGLNHLATEWRALPEPAPLPMPIQSLRQAHAPGPSERPSAPPRMALRRVLVLGGAVLLTIFAAREMGLVLDIRRPTALQVTLLVLFIALFGWIALSFLSALAGFASLLAGGGRRLGIDPAAPIPELAARTALLMPVYN